MAAAILTYSLSNVFFAFGYSVHALTHIEGKVLCHDSASSVNYLPSVISPNETTYLREVQTLLSLSSLVVNTAI